MVLQVSHIKIDIIFGNPLDSWFWKTQVAHYQFTAHIHEINSISLYAPSREDQKQTTANLDICIQIHGK